MSPAIRYFTVASLLYFVFGALLGFIMAIYPPSISYLLLTHVHFLLLGFIAMMIYSVGYHVLPRFSGFKLYSDRLIIIQFYLANIGLLGMALFWIISNDNPGYCLMTQLFFSIFAFLEFTAVCIFVFNNIMTLSGKAGRIM
jgi:cbb3-type cytochrome oxidase subunit 1